MLSRAPPQAEGPRGAVRARLDAPHAGFLPFVMIRRPVALLLLAAALLATAGCGGAPERPRVVVLALDGIDPDVVDLLVSEGRLPGFARLREEGARGRLLAREPLLSPVLWTTIATGRPPGEHGIGHFTAIEGGTGRELPATSGLRKVPALWNLVSEAGREVAVVGWWATWPAEEVTGSVVSDHACYHFLFEDGFSGAPKESVGNTWPAALEEEIEPLLRRPSSVGAEELAPFARIDAADLDRPFSFGDDLQHLRWALATAWSYESVAEHLWESRRPDLLMLYVEGTDSISHLFGHLWRVEGLAGELAEQQRRYGDTVEAVYLEADRMVRDWLERIDENTTLVVLSDHGFQLGKLHEDPTHALGVERRVSERWHRPEGILYLHGRGVRAGVELAGARQVDVAPTVLALLGLPATESMEGRVLGEGLSLDSWPPRAPDPDWRPAGAPRADAGADEAALERLRSLGYVATPSRGADRNLANVAFAEGRHAEAEAAYRRLLESGEDEASLRVSLAGALGAQGRGAEARAELERAIELNPLLPEAHHNLGVLDEHEGRVEEAIASYRRALRFSNGYPPSRDALRRLTGTAETQALTSPEERRAAALAEQARLEAVRGDFEAAAAALDEAEALAPELALVHQYRSNVAWLAGDRAGAEAALERALAIEPDNALFRLNLERLRSAEPVAGESEEQ